MRIVTYKKPIVEKRIPPDPILVSHRDTRKT